MDHTTETAPRALITPEAGGELVWHLHVLAATEPGLVGQSLTVPKRGGVLGRDPGAGGLTVRDSRLSRRHLKLTHLPSGDGLCVTDLESRNGTWVGGRRAGREALNSGAVLRAGDLVAVVVAVPVSAVVHGDETPRQFSAHPEIPGDSQVARQLRARVAAVAVQPEPALLHGPTGCGKEAAAGALHRLSGRGGPLVRVNVAAIPATLFESELFGHVKGAFSGAGGARLGRFREASGGTLVLDEIGELPLDLQSKLLRVLEEGVVRPVGGSSDVAVDVRVVGATNADLRAHVDTGRFRRDLAARLSMYTVEMPPLRARRVDLWHLCDAIAPLPSQHIASSAQGSGRGGWSSRLSADVTEALLLHPWPANLRELKATLLHLAASPQPSPLPLSALPSHIVEEVRALVAEPGAAESPEPVARARRVARPTPEALREALLQHGGNVGAAARAYGVHRRQIYRWMTYAGLSQDDLEKMRRA